MNEQAEYWSAIADRYDRVIDLQMGGGARSMARERVAREPGLGRVAEFGCGTGFFTDALAPLATAVVATDISPGMVAIARQRVTASNVTFRTEDCERTTFPDGAFDTAFTSLVLHFTVPDRAVAEMRRILRAGGLLITVNLDPRALPGAARIRALARIVYHGVVAYRVRPPRRFGRNVLSGPELAQLLEGSGFRVLGAETIRDPSRASSVPVNYVRAARV